MKNAVKDCTAKENQVGVHAHEHKYNEGFAGLGFVAAIAGIDPSYNRKLLIEKLQATELDSGTLECRMQGYRCTVDIIEQQKPV